VPADSGPCGNAEGEAGVRIFQKGFHYAQDGPGNRLVYHLQGCNLRCPWCANPEGLSGEGGTEYSVEALIQEALSCKMMFFDGGGVTLTGGEATVQFEEVKEFLSGVRSLGIRTCMETNGMSSRLEELFPVLDHLIMDLKHYDPEIHKAVTGASNERTVQNIRLALEQRDQLALRIPLIGGFNASREDAYGFCRLLTSLGRTDAVTLELLPYHEYGKGKYKSLGMEYSMTRAAFVSGEQLEQLRRIFLESGIKLINT